MWLQAAQIGDLLSAAQEEIDIDQRQVDAARIARGDTEGDSLTAASARATRRNWVVSGGSV
jgi:hypothetical protein